MNKKILPLSFILVGAALLLATVFFWIDASTSSATSTFGKSLIDWLTLILGLGASLKGWMDLLKKENPLRSTIEINIKNEGSREIEATNMHNTQNVTYINQQVVQQTPESDTPRQSIKLSETEDRDALKEYLEDIQRITRRMPWGHALTAVSSDLEISQIYVPPSLLQNENQRPAPIALDEKQERDQERREKEKATRSLRLIRVPSVSIFELVGARGPVVVVGYMGTGKSLLVNYLANMLAGSESLHLMGLNKPKTPIVIRLGDQAVMESMNLTDAMFGLASWHFPQERRPYIDQVLRNEWNRGNVVLFLDALDEYTGNLEKIKGEIDYLAARANWGNQVILTTRPSMYRLIRPAGYKRFDLGEIEPTDLDKYIRKWVQALLPESDQPRLEAESHVVFLRAQITAHPLVASIVTNPLLLTILVALSLTKDGIDLSKVENETDLYHQYVNHLIEREKLKSSASKYRDLSRLMLQVAFGYAGILVQIARTKSDPEFPAYEDVVDAISKTRYFSEESNPASLVEGCIEFWDKTGLFLASKAERYKVGFRHQAFQYFGAALGLSFLKQETRDGLLDTIGNDPQWFDSLRLYLGLESTGDFQLE